MEQSSYWEANSHSASQEISCLLWEPEVHYRVHESPPLVPILSQMHPVHPYFPKIRSNIAFPFTDSSKWYLTLAFPTKIVYEFLISPMRATCHANSIPLNLISLITFGVKHKFGSSSICSLLQPPDTSSLLVPRFPQHPLFTHRQFVFSLVLDSPSFTSSQNSR